MNPRRIMAFAALCCVISLPAMAREQIRAVGSSTVYPFVTMAAEQFGQIGHFKTPIVESTGTGGGFKLFCEGTADDTPDLSNASRPIAASEKELCKQNGVADIAEIPIGHDGIVIANQKGGPVFNLSKKQLFLALARELPDADGKLAKNPYQRWKDIDPSLPDVAIEVYGPPPSSGTRDTFVELVMEGGCEQLPAIAKLYSDAAARKKHCRLIREDGKYIEAGENYNIVVQKLMGDNQALGILGFGYYEENASKIQASVIEGVSPSIASIASGKYAISRRLYVYVKEAHLKTVPGITDFIKELTSENAIGEDGYLTDKGLIPLNESERSALKQTLRILEQ